MESALVALEQAGKVLPWEQWTKRCLELMQRLLPTAQISWLESEQQGEAWSKLRATLTATGEPQLLTKLAGRTGWGVAWQIENQTGTLLHVDALPLTEVSDDTRNYLLAIAEVAADAQRRFTLRTVQSRATTMLDLWRRSARWQQQTTLASISQAVTQELNDVLPAGRTTLLLKQGKQWRIIANNTGPIPRSVTELAQQQIALARQLAEQPECFAWEKFRSHCPVITTWPRNRYWNTSINKQSQRTIDPVGSTPRRVVRGLSASEISANDGK